jgi:uncharacterized RmlC-like cupin family protein
MVAMGKKNYDAPDESKTIGRMKVDTGTIGALQFERHTAAPGWKWSEDIKPVAKTGSCQLDHLIYLVSGRIHTRLDDGTAMDFGPGDTCRIPPGHDGWTVGNEPAVWLEIPH